MVTREHTNYSKVIWTFRVFLVAHLLTVAGGLLVAKGIDHGLSPLGRAKYVANNSALWKFGWGLWQFASLSDLFVSIGLIIWCKRFGRSRLRWAIAAFVFELGALIPEQFAEVGMITKTVDLARQVNIGDGLDKYVSYEKWTTDLGSIIAGLFYVAMTLCWVMAITGTLSISKTKRTPFILWTYFVSTVFTLVSVILYLGRDGSFNVTPYVTAVAGISFAALIPWCLLAVDAIAVQSGRVGKNSALRFSFLYTAPFSLPLVRYFRDSVGVRDLLWLQGN